MKRRCNMNVTCLGISWGNGEPRGRLGRQGGNRWCSHSRLVFIRKRMINDHRHFHLEKLFFNRNICPPVLATFSIPAPYLFHISHEITFHISHEIPFITSVESQSYSLIPFQELGVSKKLLSMTQFRGRPKPDACAWIVSGKFPTTLSSW